MRFIALIFMGLMLVELYEAQNHSDDLDTNGTTTVSADGEEDLKALYDALEKYLNVTVELQNSDLPNDVEEVGTPAPYKVGNWSLPDSEELQALFESFRAFFFGALPENSAKSELQQ